VTTLPPLPPEWPTHRATLRRLATHVLARARKAGDNLFDLEPSAGGFATPAVGAERVRVRISGPVLVVERASGATLSSLRVSTTSRTIDGSTLAELCALAGVEPDPGFDVGPDTPELGDVDEPIALAAGSSEVLGAWYGLGREAIDRAVAATPVADASLARLWPEHFDYGIDLDAAPGVRVNLGAAAGDGFHEEPYLYVGPWGDERPGPPGFWNAPFGAVLGFAEVGDADDPIERAASFFLEGLARLASG
jgi:hypothetical protein